MGKIKIYEFESVDSTNNKAKEASFAEDSYIIYTKNQTNGRGQYNRKWISKKGLTFSVVMKKEIKDAFAIVPKAIIKFLNDIGFEAEIKQPNDIYYCGKKLCGILIETIYKEFKIDKTIIGIGININEDEKICDKINGAISIKCNLDDYEIMERIYNYINNENRKG